jgi:hypothetical protein
MRIKGVMQKKKFRKKGVKECPHFVLNGKMRHKTILHV